MATFYLIFTIESEYVHYLCILYNFCFLQFIILHTISNTLLNTYLKCLKFKQNMSLKGITDI